MAEIGVIASIVGVAGAGAKLSLVLFGFASTVGSARVEVERVGTEISQFCAVLTQLRSTLKESRARKFSDDAIRTTQDILERCQKIFQEIEDIVVPLQRSTRNSKETSVDLVARVKWTFRRSKVQVLQKTLESSKNSLHLMLQILHLAQKTPTPRVSTVDTILEDEQEQTVIHSLIVAHERAVNQLERLESEEAEEQNSEAREQSSSATETQSPTTGIDRLQTRDGANRMPGLFDEQPIYSPAASGSGKQKRASTWVKDLIFDNSPLPSGFRRQTWGDGISSMDNAQQAYYLVQKWTDKPSNMINPSVQTTNSPQQGPQDISAAKVEEHVPVQENSHESTQESTSGLEDTIESAPSDPSKAPLVHLQSSKMYVEALRDYADDQTSLSFREGDIIQVVAQLETGWWEGVINGHRGWFPSDYCKLWSYMSASSYEEYEDDSDDSDSDDEDDEEHRVGEEIMLTAPYERIAFGLDPSGHS